MNIALHLSLPRTGLMRMVYITNSLSSPSVEWYRQRTVLQQITPYISTTISRCYVLSKQTIGEYNESGNTGSVFGIYKRGMLYADRRTCVETVCQHPPMKENVQTSYVEHFSRRASYRVFRNELTRHEAAC